MKICRECGKTKILDDFYRHSEMADGHLNICKECVKAKVRQHRENNIERIRAYDRLRGFHGGGKGASKNKKEWIERNSEKRKAHMMVDSALKSGAITRSDQCEICGNKKRLFAHHTDYSEPLIVVWLCDKCHKDVHRLSAKPYLEYLRTKIG
jgi:hypothetical protein